MPTTVANIKNAEAFDVYIGGPGKGEEGYFGNFAVPLFYRGKMTREECLEVYRAYFRFRVKTDPEFRRRVLALRGKRLGCFCKPQACHGDVIAEWVDAQAEQP
jgi:hypothetical protein